MGNLFHYISGESRGHWGGFAFRRACVVIFSLLPFPMIRPYHYRYNGDIVCQGRAVVRVRIREHVVRVQDRDTEIGAVVRTARASRDMTRFPFFFNGLRRLYILYNYCQGYFSAGAMLSTSRIGFDL